MGDCAGHWAGLIKALKKDRSRYLSRGVPVCRFPLYFHPFHCSWKAARPDRREARPYDCPGGKIASGLTGFPPGQSRSEEHTSELQSLMRISYAVFCLKKKIN